MGFDFRFREADSTKDLKMLIDFLAKQSLGYPNFDDWLQKAGYEIGTGYKRTVLALSSGHLVGDAIYQPHKELEWVREVKNLRVHPDLRNRYFANFMLRQVEAERKEEYDVIMCDVSANQQDVISFLLFSGYVPLMRKPLYSRDSEDVVMVKCFNDETEQGILHNARTFISGINV